MAFDPETHHRRSIRLRGYDYSQPGVYFATVCAHGRQHLFGEVVEGEMHRSEFGEIVATCWRRLAKDGTRLELGEWVVMPNHFHGIIVIPDCRGGSRTAPTKSLGRIVGAFKTMSAHRINVTRQTPGAPVWQRNYYEHVVRDARELEIIREYLRTNPARWATDPENFLSP